MNTDALISLQNLKIKHCTLKDYFDKQGYDDTHDEIISFFQNLGDTKINEQQTLRSFLECLDLSLWSLWEYHLAYELFPRFLARKILALIIKKENPSEIILIADHHNLEETTVSMASVLNISVTICYPNPLVKIKNIFDSIYNYPFTTNDPWTMLFKKIPFVFVWIEKIKKIIALLSPPVDLNRCDQRCIQMDTQEGKKKILIISFYMYYNFIREMPNLLEAFRQHSDFSVTIVRADIVQRDFVQMCEKEMIPYRTFQDYLKDDIEVKQKQLSENFFERIKDLDLGSVLNQQKSAVGMLTQKEIERFLKVYFCKYSLSRMVRLRLVTERLLEKEKPDFVLIQEDSSAYGQTVSSVLREKNVEFLVTTSMPALFDYDIFFNIFSRKNKPTTKITVTHQKAKDLLMRYKAREENVTITGSPIFEKLVTGDFYCVKKEDIYKRFNINKERKMILFTSQNLPYSDRIHCMLINMMEHFPDTHLLLKIHPAEYRLRDMIAIRRARFRNISIVKDFDIWSLISASELLITISSITGMEAMVLKKPVVIIEMSPYCDTMNYLEANPSPYVESGAALGIYRPADLIPTVKRILNDRVLREEMIKKGEDFVAANLGPADGKVSQRIVSLVGKGLHKKLNSHVG
jgi:hypothetical protein